MARKPVASDAYLGFADIRERYLEGRDFRITDLFRPATECAVIAPHGGRIERGTSRLARAIAGEEFSLYLFEGIRPEGANFRLLHLTSSRFDEPRCLALVAACRFVISIHGFKGTGEEVLLGGLDESLKHAIALRLDALGVECRTGDHRYPAIDPNNICNRGRSARGVQLEVSAALRGSERWGHVAQACRDALSSINPVAGS